LKASLEKDRTERWIIGSNDEAAGGRDSANALTMTLMVQAFENVGIIRVGIGGLTTAHALLRPGTRVRIFERSFSLRDAGPAQLAEIAAMAWGATGFRRRCPCRGRGRLGAACEHRSITPIRCGDLNRIVGLRQLLPQSPSFGPHRRVSAGIERLVLPKNLEAQHISFS
jgi:hypothetical protein